MQVFKACLKVIKKNLPSMVTYIGVFLALVVLITMFYQPPADEMFNETKPRMAVFNLDAGNPFSDALTEFVSSRAQIINLPLDKEAIQDALFHREVSYMLTIPEGFGESFLSGSRSISLEKTTLPDSYASIQTDLLIGRYLRLAALYADAESALSSEQITEMVSADLDQVASVQMVQAENNGDYNPTVGYFTYLAYSLIAVMILCISSTLIVFNQKDLRRRNMCAPVNMVQFNLQLFLANLVFALAVWLVMILVSLPLGANQISRTSWLLYSLNALVFTLACLSLSFLVCQFIRSRPAQQAAANVIALGTCFISGVFVPMELLGSGVRFVASFTPTYWYIQGVRHIQVMPTLDAAQVRTLAEYLLIQIGFVIALLVLGLAVYKQKRQSNN